MTTLTLSIAFSENNALAALAAAGVTWETFADLSATIRGIAHTCPVRAYDKTEVVLTTADGESDSFRLDIVRPDDRRAALANDVRGYILAGCRYSVEHASDFLKPARAAEVAAAAAHWAAIVEAAR